MKRTWRKPHVQGGTEYETCPDCSDRDAVSFTFGHVERLALDDLDVSVGGSHPVLSFARSEKGQSLTRGCERCGGSGRIPVRRKGAPGL